MRACLSAFAFVKKWLRREDGAAAIEAAILFPVLVALLAATYDLGKGVILNGRTITASQVVADLISRNKQADLNGVDDAIAAAGLVYQPYTLNNFGIDIVSLEFNSKKQPVVLWRETRNMSANTTAVNSLSGIGDEGEGMVVVSVKYTYKPLFAQYFTGNFDMQEVAFARGRRSPTVTWGG